MGVFRVILTGKFNGVDDTKSVFTFESDGGLVASTVEASVWMDTLMTPTFLAQIPTVWSATKLTIETPNLAAPGHWQFTDEVTYIHPGTYPGESLPQQVAAVIIGVTASRRRGKKFIPAIAETGQANGVVNPGFLAIMSAYGAAYISPMTLVSGTAASGLCRPDGTSFLPFINYRLDTILGSQRRRKQGSGS